MMSWRVEIVVDFGSDIPHFLATYGSCPSVFGYFVCLFIFHTALGVVVYIE